MEEISPALRRYDVVEKPSREAQALSKVQLTDQNKDAAVSGEPLRKTVENFFFTNSISRSSPTMARCSAAKAAKDPNTNFMAPGEPNPQVGYGPSQLAGASA